MTELPPSIITTEELEREEWLLNVVNCELAQIAAGAYERAIEFGYCSEEVKELASSNQVRAKLLANLKAQLIACMNKRLSKTVQHLGGTA